MSAELKSFLTSIGTASSHTTAYNPQGNGQTERYNGVIWKTVMLALKSKGLEVNRWECVLSEALHAIRSLLCTSTNETPHERMFKHQRRSSCGSSLPSWLTAPGPVLMRKHANPSKYDPQVEEVSLLEVNPNYAFVRLPNGTETTVSLRHLAPRGTEDTTSSEDTIIPPPRDETLISNQQSPSSHVEQEGSHLLPSNPQNRSTNDFLENSQRPQRLRRPPSYLKDYVSSSLRGGN